MTFFLVFVSVPDAAPVIYSVLPSSSEECKLSWNPIPAEHHRGVLLGFRVVYTAVNDTKDSSNITVDKSIYENVTVNGLKPYTDYLLKVAGFTSKGDGNYSIPVTCQTLESGEFLILPYCTKINPNEFRSFSGLFSENERNFALNEISAIFKFRKIVVFSLLRDFVLLCETLKRKSI